MRSIHTFQHCPSRYLFYFYFLELCGWTRVLFALPVMWVENFNFESFTHVVIFFKRSKPVFERHESFVERLNLQKISRYSTSPQYDAGQWCWPLGHPSLHCNCSIISKTTRESPRLAFAVLYSVSLYRSFMYCAVSIFVSVVSFFSVTACAFLFLFFLHNLQFCCLCYFVDSQRGAIRAFLATC